MQHVEINRHNINIEALDAALRTALGNATTGVSTGPYGVIVHLTDDATPAQINQLRTIVQSHDPAVLSPRQQAQQQRQQKLAAMREDYQDVAVDPAAYGSEKAIIQALAQKLALLEQEVLDLRGGRDG